MSTEDIPTVPVPEGVSEGDLPKPDDFPTTRIRRGYHTGQVDSLISEVFDAVRHGQPAPEIAGVKFEATLLGQGYREDAVDKYLDELSTAIGQEPTPDAT